MPAPVLALLIGAAIVAAINYNRPRVLFWIVLGAANFSATYAYSYAAPWWMPHAAIVGLGDFFTAMTIDSFRRERWELWVQRCFAAGMLLSVAALFGWIGRIEFGAFVLSYGTLLEFTNWFALLFMGVDGILKLADERSPGMVVGQGARPGHRRLVHRARAFLESEKRARGVVARAAASWEG